MTDPSDYARQVETYLCQKNRGHLVRVVGPAFELVCGWAERGVPLKVALLGIDRCCSRLSAKGPRRRPVRIEFCEADVLDAFDDWRRAVGAGAPAAEPDARGEAPPRKPALGSHVERAIARLAHARGAGPASTALQQQIDATIRELEDVSSSAARARGEARAGIIARLGGLDLTLMQVAITSLDAARAAGLRTEAAEELAPFGGRMPPAARERAIQLAFERLVRHALALPTLTYE